MNINKLSDVNLLAMMENIEIDSEESSSFYIELFNRAKETLFVRQHGFIHRNWKPYSLTHPQLFDKMYDSKHFLKLHYWQMDYEDAIVQHRDLPFSTWEIKRKQYLQRGNK